MRQFLLNIITLILFSRFAIATPLENPTTTNNDVSTIEMLASQMREFSSMHANFAQTITDNTGTLMQRASGILKIKKPRQLYWQTKQPFEHLVVTDGSQLWLYDRDLDQVTQQALNDSSDQSPALLLSGDVTAITNNYRVELLSSSHHNYHFKLLPHSAEGLFTALEISFSNGKISSMTMSDSFDQLTRFDFSEVSINEAIDDSFFEFIIPEGVDLIIDGS